MLVRERNFQWYFSLFNFTLTIVAFELWTISDNIAFDNILITDDVDIANLVSSLTYEVKKEMTDLETDNILIKAMKHANKNPWMWAVYLFAIGIPVVLFIAFCCVSPIKSKEKRDDDTYDAARAKKTDYSSPDIIPEVSYFYFVTWISLTVCYF